MTLDRIVVRTSGATAVIPAQLRYAVAGHDMALRMGVVPGNAARPDFAVSSIHADPAPSTHSATPRARQVSTAQQGTHPLGRERPVQLAPIGCGQHRHASRRLPAALPSMNTLRKSPARAAANTRWRHRTSDKRRLIERQGTVTA
jgi:hypothetical protein